MNELIRNLLREQNKTKIALYSAVVGNILIWSLFFSLPDGNLHLKVYDVGQGDAIFLNTAGGYKILVDGGPGSKVLNYLGKDIPFHSKNIDLLILTHPQADHLAGLIEVVKRYQIKTLWLSNTRNDSKLFGEWQEVLMKEKIPTTEVYQGDKMIFPDKTEISVLWPKRGLVNSDLNAHSVVVLISYGAFDALLTGDADKQVQPYTSSSDHVEVFKIPHHGAKDSIDENFISTISPDISIISVGSKNSYGHPSQEIINFLEKNGSKVYRTDKNGTVEIVSNGKSWYTKAK